MVVSVVADDPPLMLAGDLVDTIDEALSHVPTGATPVVFHSAVLAYLDRSHRARFAGRLRDHPDVIWIGTEAPGVMDNVTSELQPPPTANARAFFVVSLGTMTSVAISDPHGSWIRWPD